MKYYFDICGDRDKDDQAFLETVKSLMHDSNSLKSFYGILANLAVLIDSYLEDVSWCGFYLLDEDNLCLGPFQGNIACESIKVGNGVCGTAVKENRTMLIEDVNKFPTHIACDTSSRSEIVSPFYDNKGNIFGVIDWDSPSYYRFTQKDVILIERISQIISLSIKF
ncbi:MAG: GAF domain-containing protein [Sphaerochaetaceae bacterium]|nr:GAF domain-containing protein [Sphaerochaetaceae bacterium]